MHNGIRDVIVLLKIIATDTETVPKKNTMKFCLFYAFVLDRDSFKFDETMPSCQWHLKSFSPQMHSVPMKTIENS